MTWTGSDDELGRCPSQAEMWQQPVTPFQHLHMTLVFRSSVSRRLATRAAAAVMEKTATFTGKGVSPPRKGHHFLHIDDFSKEELSAMLQTAMKVP